MNNTKSKLEINRDLNLLAPFFVKRLNIALSECKDSGYGVALFEGYRSGFRQDWLYESGRTRDGKIITNAKAGQSWHQLGVAADIVGFTNNHWDWSIDYDRVEQIMISHGFSSLKFERAHFQITGGMSIVKAATIANERGLLALWSIIESSLK
jgi:peptidoglycan L-alanyl-D-glutamate endopeptidase CwlK